MCVCVLKGFTSFVSGKTKCLSTTSDVADRSNSVAFAVVPSCVLERAADSDY